MANALQKLNIFLASLLCFAIPTASAQNLTDEVVAGAARTLVKDKLVDGISIGFIEGDHYGMVHLGTSDSTGARADNATVYELGGMSSLFTGILLSDAVVRGEIELDSIAKAANRAKIELPAHDDRAITWLDLATHRSGLSATPANLEAKNPADPFRFYNSTRAQTALASYQFTRSPGDAQEFSIFGMSILGYLLAENAGTTYQNLLQSRIAKPLGMRDCTVDLTSDQKKRFATPHERAGAPTLAWTFADLPGGCGIHATLFDMMRFAKAQLNPPPGKLGEALELAWKKHSDADATGMATGLGWVIAGDGETRWHNGRTGGSHCALFVNRRIRSAVVVLCNTAEPKVDVLATGLLQTAAGLKAASASVPQDKSEKTAPKLSPFTSVGFHQETAFVAYNGQVYQWLALNGITVPDIVASSKKQFGDDWEKRICEDLVEVLWGMGHEPGKTVKLQLQDAKTKRELVIERAPMTRENRSAVVEDRKRAGLAGGNDVKVDAKTRRRLVGRYKLAANFIFDVQDKDGRLMVGITNQPTQEVFPDSSTRWSYRSVDATLEFKLGRTGPARQLVLHQDGRKQTATRIGR